MIWRENSETWWLSTLWSRPDVHREPAGELARATVGEEARRHLEQPGEQLAPEPRHRLLADRAQQIRLQVVEHRLRAEQRHQAERDAVEQGAIAVHEGGVEEVPHHHRKREAREAAQDQGDRRRRTSMPRYGRTRGQSRSRRPGFGRRAERRSGRKGGKELELGVRRSPLRSTLRPSALPPFRPLMGVCAPPPAPRPDHRLLAGPAEDDDPVGRAGGRTGATGRSPWPRTAGRDRAASSGTSARPPA